MTTPLKKITPFLILAVAGGCNSSEKVTGNEPEIFTLESSSGIEATITNYGARLISLKINGTDIVLGHDSLPAYLAGDDNFGAVIGRYANRIADGTFTIGDSVFHVERNLPPHHLHGGDNGFHNRLWTPEVINDSTLRLTFLSPDGDAGFPGNLNVAVTYSLSADTLSIGYTATTDTPTVLNLTNHSYFNLSGNPEHNVLNHVLWIGASTYTPTDSTMIPTGAIEPVAGTPLDFTTPKPIGQEINSEHQQMIYANGFDHNLILDACGDLSQPAAILYSPESGISMTIYTDQPALQLYTTNSMKKGMTGKHGIPYHIHSAVCLEPQHYPDSPNRPEFPSTRLDPGKTFYSTTRYCFKKQPDGTLK